MGTIFTGVIKDYESVFPFKDPVLDNGLYSGLVRGFSVRYKDYAYCCLLTRADSGT